MVGLGMVAGLLLLVWKGPELFANPQDRAVRNLAKMARQAKRHNTIVRYHYGIPFVITHQRRGLVYMLNGEFVSRERLIAALGKDGPDLVYKVEGEERMSIPNPTRITLLDPPKIKN
ncbi:MAG: hypothetical protein K6T57_07035 [Thermaceae bacterium]|nr:hypothetical protein [Thermaceae bacterium]